MEKIKPTQILIETLESFGDCEPEHVLVLYINEAGFLVYRSNIDSVSLRVGLCESAKAFFLQDMTARRLE